MRYALLIAIVLLSLGQTALPMAAAAASAESALPPLCRDIEFEGAPFVACTVDSQRNAIRLHLDDASGRPYGSLAAFARSGPPVIFAMNAGMYLEDLKPQGLYIEQGRTISQLDTGAGDGNFHLLPNGVFAVSNSGSSRVVPSQAVVSYEDMAFATQSGPMLVIDGALHPAFGENGTSRYIRNGVGVRDDGMVVFAISRAVVSFGRFARLFRDALDCPNALYLDGFVSALADDNGVIIGGSYPAGPIVSVEPR